MSFDQRLIHEMAVTGREISLAETDDPKLGPLRWLPGKWENTEELKAHGFNMIALPYAESENGFRLLMNQYHESLIFDFKDVGVPNRGVDPATGQQADQIVAALGYTQLITQISSEDSFLVSARGQAVPTLSKTNISDIFQNQGIHHEPGLFLSMTNHNISDEAGNEINIARTASIPHGNTFTAVGSSLEENWEILSPEQRTIGIPRINGVVVGGGSDPDERALDPIVDPATNLIRVDYFAPYRYFHQNPFKGSSIIPGFEGFEPVNSTNLLRHTRRNVLNGIGSPKRVIRLSVDSTIDHSGINRLANPSIGNTPFIARQADTTAMNATFIIYEIEDSLTGRMRYFLQYAQNVILDFINRPDGHPGRARWPHISINTLERVSGPSPQAIMESLPSR